MTSTELAPLLARYAEGADRTGCPYPGTWQHAPFPERTTNGARYSLVAVDPGVSALGVRHDDGSLWCLPDDAPPHLLNTGVEAFIAFNRAYAEAAAEAAAYEGPGDDLPDDEAVDLAEQAADALTEALLERFGATDPDAVADENSFWCVGAEELGYGMST
ncbi:SUKH-4 family immunity protein [Streptomyces sp. NPDC050504]|uniref:SUKH-4 family immunity protein n=1 Tax=Streptomyces sp. NPDC050504 TaxID=3365618 RepID=UPI0037BB2505